jgi:hypothetical protein
MSEKNFTDPKRLIRIIVLIGVAIVISVIIGLFQLVNAIIEPIIARIGTIAFINILIIPLLILFVALKARGVAFFLLILVAIIDITYFSWRGTYTNELKGYEEVGEPKSSNYKYNKYYKSEYLFLFSVVNQEQRESVLFKPNDQINVRYNFNPRSNFIKSLEGKRCKIEVFMIEAGRNPDKGIYVKTLKFDYHQNVKSFDENRGYYVSFGPNADFLVGNWSVGVELWVFSNTDWWGNEQWDRHVLAKKEIEIQY